MADPRKISNALSQAQVDAEAVYAKAASIDPYQAALIKKNAQGNIMSPGVLTALSNLGVDTNSGVGNSLANIDAATRDQRLADQKKVAAEREKNNFNNTLRGKFWTGLKGVVRGGVTILSTPIELIDATYRAGGMSPTQAVKDLFNPAGQAKRLESQPNAIEQTVSGQVILESWKNFKKKKPFYADINMGSGFLPNEETGVAHAARQASLSAAKVAIRDDSGKVVGYRAATFFGDKAANVFTLGNPETQSGAVIAAVADIVGSFVVDPGIARAQNIKNLQKIAAQQRASNAVQAAAKTEERIAELTRLQDEALAEATALRNSTSNLKNVEAETAKSALGVGLSRAERQAQATQRIKSAQSVRIAQARLDEFSTIEAKEVEALASAREARLAAEAAFKAPRQVERAEKALAKQRKQLEEMTSQREESISRGLTPFVPEEDIAALADSIRVAEQNIADTRNLITAKASVEELVKDANPNIKRTDNVGLVDTNFIRKFAEFDRAGAEAVPGYSAEAIAKIAEELKSGKGFDNPLILDYSVDAAGELSLRLVEGNHRVLAALEAGIDYIPVRFVKGRAEDMFSAGVKSKVVPDKTGYLPGDMSPNEILPEGLVKQAQAMAKAAVTPEDLAVAKDLEAKALRRLREVRGERQFAERQVVERSRTQSLMDKATQQASRQTLKAVKNNATLADKLNDATLSAADRKKAWELAVLRLSNAEQTLERPEFAYQNIAEFLTNGHGTAAVDRLVKITDWKEIWRKSGQRLTAEQARAIADATTPDEVVDALAPFLKRGEIKAGVIEPSAVGARMDAAAGRLSQLGQAIDARTNYIVPEARKLFGAGAKVAQRISHHEKVAALSGAVVKASKAITRSYTTKVKGGSIVNIHDREALLVAVEDFGKAAKLPQNILDDLIEKIALAESNSVAGYISSAKLLDAVFANAAGKIPAHLKTSFEQYTTAFKDSNEEMASYWANRHATGAHIKFLTQNGKSVILPGPHLDSELLNSTIYLPPVSELLKMTSRVAKYSSITKGREVADKVIGDWWKKTVLVRPAYIIRNIAEEQIRVAAVGHASFFTRPGLALAMWLGKEDGPYVRRLLKQFDTYDNTVFGDSFSSGDEALDVLDETLGHGLKNSFVDMMNSGKTGADERDFRVLTFRNVSDVPFGHKRFFDGVTNQLRMLNSSEFGRVVAGYNPKFVKDAMAKGQFRQEAVVDYFLTGPGRRTLDAFAGGTPQDFSAFIKTPEGLKAYLFTGKSDKGIDVSVLARVSETTGGNRVLQNLIAYGKVTVGGKDLSIPRPARDAMNSIQNSKAMREGKKALLEEQDLLAKDIKSLFADSGNWENVRVNVPSKNVAFAEGEKDKVGLVNRFFEISTTLEKNTTFGPEFRQAYWDAINEIALTLDSNAKTKLLEVAQKSLTPLQKAGGKSIATGRVFKDEQEVVGLLNSQRAKGFTIDNFKEFEESIVNYMSGSGDYSLVNSVLRGTYTAGVKETARANKIVSDLDALIKKAPKLEESITTFRGISDKNVVDKLLSLKPGDSFADEAFVSTSLKEDTAQRFARNNGVIIEIVNPAGTKGIFPIGLRTEVDANLAMRASSENEFLLPRDTKFYVTEVKGNRIKVTLDNNAGMNIGSKHPVWNAFKSAKGDGPLTLEDAHIYADNVAREHVKELFYNAQEKRLIFHQLRLIAPFANAWENTITKWVELGTENPLAVYKAVKVLDWLNSPESSALYQMTDAKEYYDPNQGFFFTDPNSGQRQFFVPFAGTVMASLAKGITGVDYKGAPIAFSANPMSFNFAFGQGTMLPGVGPGVTLPLSVLGTFNGNYIDAMPVGVQKWLFPYGRANFSGGLQTAVLPGNWNRIIGGLTGMEQTYASNFKPVMNYLASGANYNLDDADDQAQLVKDTDTFARWESVMRGVIGLVSPMALIQQGLGQDKDGDITLQTTLYEDFQTLYQKNDGDYNKAWFDFLNLYGAPQAFALISSSAGEGPSNWDSYQFVVENPDVATKYKDVWGYIMPGGGLSTEMYKWNVAHDTKVKLTPTQILQKVNNQRFYAAKDALLTQVDAGMMDKSQFSEALKTLKDAMGGGPVYEFDLTRKTRRISQLNELVADERFVDIPSVTALRNYMAIRQHILTTIGKTDFTGAQNEQPARDYLAAQAEWIVKEYPDFQKMFYGFFANELEGR